VPAASILAFASSLSPFFPAIVNWLKGESGEKIAENIVEAAQSVTGQDDRTSIFKTLSSNPKALIEFQQTLLKIAKIYRLEEVADRATARARDMAFIQAGRSNKRADIMVLSAASGLVLCLISLGLYKSSLPGEAVGIISTIAGIFGGCLKDAYAFEFGSSRGRKEKDVNVKDLLKVLR
jgi:Flp pilus assembly protein TadB